MRLVKAPVLCGFDDGLEHECCHLRAHVFIGDFAAQLGDEFVAGVEFTNQRIPVRRTVALQQLCSRRASDATYRRRF